MPRIRIQYLIAELCLVLFSELTLPQPVHSPLLSRLKLLKILEK
jgi:hypothetical protein